MEIFAYHNLVFKVDEYGRVLDIAVLVIDRVIQNRVARENHGTITKYTKQRCRCWRCVEANNTYKRAYNGRRRAEARKAKASSPVTTGHGS